ncbi:SUMO1 [Symbiodinium sp. CCMP2592]|nr:SUMO1 [Symbiodinium sp. CCMP2592]
MMKAWCDHHQVPAEEAAFLLGERLVKPEDTLATLGSGTDSVVFRAVPCDQAESAKEATPKKRGRPREAKAKPKSPKPKEKPEKPKGKGKGKSKGKRKGTDEVARQEEEPKKEAEKTEEPSDQQKVSVKVEAEGADGLNELRFNMRLSTPLAKMMQAWCEHHQVPMEDAAFLLGKVALKPEDTLHGLGCSDGKEVVVRAVPREEEEANREAEKTEAQVPREEEPKKEAEKTEEPSDQQKVSVKVEAEGADGLNELRFNMRLSTPLAKMMQAWCEHHQVPMEDAAFLLGKVALKPEDTLHGLGCSDGKEVVVRAVPRADQEAAAASLAAVPSAAPTVAAAAATAAVPSVAPAAAVAELEESSAKVSVKVLAEGADGVNELCFSVRTTTPLGKMMKAWCDHHQVPAEEAAFLLGERLVKPEDTLATLGSGTDSVVFRAVPRDQVESAKEATPKKRGGPKEAKAKPKSPKLKEKPEKAEKVAKAEKPKAKAKSKGKRKWTEEDSDSDGAREQISSGEAVSGARRSQRLRDPESPSTQVTSSTLVHHPPQEQRTRKGLLAPELTNRMSFREYLAYDREQERQRNQARLDRQKRKLVNGESSDEDLQLALALSMSESQERTPQDGRDDGS